MAKMRKEFWPFTNLAQLECLLKPLNNRHQYAQEAKFDYHARKILFEPYFRALLLYPMSESQSLNGLTQAVSKDPLFAVLGAHFEVSVPAFSLANAHRPSQPFFRMLRDVEAQLNALGLERKTGRGLSPPTLEAIADLLGKTRIFDASVFPLPPRIADWARVTEGQAGAKLLLKIGGGYGGLEKVIVRKQREHEGRYFEKLLELKEGEEDIYLFDAGFADFGVFDRIHLSGNHFVTTIKSNYRYEVVEERSVPVEPLACGYRVVRDQVIRLGAEARDGKPVLYRRLETEDTRGNPSVLLTDLLTWPAEKICALKRYRWAVEVVFRFFKSQLKLKRLISWSPSGVVKQIVVALILYGLLVLYHQEGGPFSLVRVKRFMRTELHWAEAEWYYERGWERAMRKMRGSNPIPPPRLDREEVLREIAQVIRSWKIT